MRELYFLHSSSRAVDVRDSQHVECIRSIVFDADSRLMAVAGDDKLISVWETATWSVVARGRPQKKVAAIAFAPSHAPTHVFAGDRFGDIVSFPLPPAVLEVARGGILSSSSSSSAASADAATLQPCARTSFGHYSQITSLVLAGSPQRPLLISGDVDTRLRVGRFPHTFDIVSMCLGNRECVV